MEGVRPALYYGVELAAGGVPEFRGELILQQRKFRDRVVGNANQWTGYPFIVVVDALDCKVVVPGPLATHGWAGPHTNSAARSHARA